MPKISFVVDNIKYNLYPEDYQLDVFDNNSYNCIESFVQIDISDETGKIFVYFIQKKKNEKLEICGF